MTAVTLVLGASAALRESKIAGTLDPALNNAVILEGLPDGSSDLLESLPRDAVARIAPGCACCTGNLTMRVTLNRVLRKRPAHLYIGLAPTPHLESIRAFLSAPPYDQLLHLTKDLHA